MKKNDLMRKLFFVRCKAKKHFHLFRRKFRMWNLPEAVREKAIFIQTHATTQPYTLPVQPLRQVVRRALQTHVAHHTKPP